MVAKPELFTLILGRYHGTYSQMEQTSLFELCKTETLEEF